MAETKKTDKKPDSAKKPDPKKTESAKKPEADKKPVKDYKHLIPIASKARGKAYAPYSKFKVGAALLTKTKKVYAGCNIENAAFGASLCAERVAFGKAISEGEREFEAIVVVGGKTEEEVVSPCGQCLQFMCELCDEDFVVVLKSGKSYESFTLGELMPMAFTKKDLR